MSKNIKLTFVKLQCWKYTIFLFLQGVLLAQKINTMALWKTVELLPAQIQRCKEWVLNYTTPYDLAVVIMCLFSSVSFIKQEPLVYRMTAIVGWLKVSSTLKHPPSVDRR